MLLVRIVLTVALGAAISGALVRFSPGFETDEAQLDSRLSDDSRRRLRELRLARGHLPTYYWRFTTGYLSGDLGESVSLGKPVKELLAERIGITSKSVALGLVLGWTAALLLTAAAGMSKIGAALLAAATSLFVSIPAALLGLLLVIWNSGGSGLVIACAIFPRLARYLHNLLSASSQLPHVLMARARGISNARVFLDHILRPCLSEVIALIGLTVSIALSAVVAAEVVLDIPGLGQLAWQAAIGRDLNLLVNLTVLITATVTIVNGASGWISARLR